MEAALITLRSSFNRALLIPLVFLPVNKLILIINADNSRSDHKNDDERVTYQCLYFWLLPEYKIVSFRIIISNILFQIRQKGSRNEIDSSYNSLNLAGRVYQYNIDKTWFTKQ